jgi:hypothetical protein
VVLLWFGLSSAPCRGTADRIARDLLRRRLIPAGLAGTLGPRGRGQFLAILLGCSEVALEALAEAREEARTL